MKDRKKVVIVVCVIGIVLLLMSLPVLKIIEKSQKNKETSEMYFAYNHLVEKYKEDKETSSLTDGKYSFISMFENGKNLTITGEFNVENDNLIYICIFDGSRIMTLENEKITKKYLKENAKFKDSTKTCKFDK